jgi:5-formyltetrahydrofolate cyclo-ligase
MPDPSTDKARLREQLRQRRKALTADERQSASQNASHQAQALPDWERSTRIALYLAADGELDPAQLAALCRKQDKSLYLPIIQQDNSLVFALWRPEQKLTANRYGIPEPPPDSDRLRADDMDIIFLPLVGWDEQGNRLGMGGGFYDRTLDGATRPLLVGLAHDCQQVAALPRESWDISLDFVVTGSALVQCRESLR